MADRYGKVYAIGAAAVLVSLDQPMGSLGYYSLPLSKV
jgi:hypothetical protein